MLSSAIIHPAINRRSPAESRSSFDEIILVLEGINEIDSASFVAEHILGAVEKPITISGQEVLLPPVSVLLSIHPIAPISMNC